MEFILRYLAVALAAVLVFGAAKYMDNTPVNLEKETKQEATVRQETETVPEAEKETAAQTEPKATKPVETKPAETEPAATEPAETEPQERRYVLTFAGDCTFGGLEKYITAGYGFNKTVGTDYGYPFRNVQEYFRTDDFTMVNLEGVLGDQGQKSGKRYDFRGKEAYVNILTQNYVEAVTLANNHTMDYGSEGYARTKEILEEKEILYVEANDSLLVTLEGGLKIAIYGTVYNNIDELETIENIKALKEAGADLVIYAPHWGVENTFRPNQQQTNLAHAVIDAGADIIYGSHPHVLQPVEEYGDGVIFYSLGNFSFGGNMYPKDYDTAFIQQEVIRAADGTVTLGERTLIPCRISSIDNRNDFQPTPYKEGSADFERTMDKLNGTYKGKNLAVD